jgi:hypothetical protein
MLRRKVDSASDEEKGCCCGGRPLTRKACLVSPAKTNILSLWLLAKRGRTSELLSCTRRTLGTQAQKGSSFLLRPTNKSDEGARYPMSTRGHFSLGPAQLDCLIYGFP